MHSKVADDWVQILPFVQGVMNFSVYSLTDFTPTVLLLCTGVNLSRTVSPQSAAVFETKIALPSIIAPAGLGLNSQFFSTWLAERNKVQQQVLQTSIESKVLSCKNVLPVCLQRKLLGSMQAIGCWQCLTSTHSLEGGQGELSSF